MFAMRKLAYLFWSGADDVPKNRQCALELYERALLEDPKAIVKACIVSVLFPGGEGVERNLPRALELQQQVVDEEESKNQWSLIILANIISARGEEFEPDHRRAFALYEQAAGMGGASARFVLGVIYECAGMESWRRTFARPRHCTRFRQLQRI